MKHTKSYHQGHFNPLMYRENYLSLNGNWKFMFDDDDIGLNYEYHKFLPSPININVPYAYQAKLSGINLPDKQCDVIWYEKDFEINDLSKTYILHFLGVDYKTQVYINGIKVFTHEGGYDAFDVILDEFIHLGNNKVILRVTDKAHLDQLRGKQSWRNKNFACYYTPTSGIHKSVYLETVNKSYISYLSFFGDYENKKLTFHVESKNATNYIVKLIFLNQEYAFKISSEVEEFIIDFDEVVPWNALNPYLYDAKVFLVYDGNVFDEIETYFGFKSIKCQNGHVFINNKDTYLKLVLNQGYYKDGLTTSSEKEIIEDLSLIKECGFNGFRMHQVVPEPMLFYYADIMGLLCWQEVPSAANYSSKTYQRAFIEIPLQIKEHFSHPCIMTYTLFNESWGINDIKSSLEMQKFTVDIVNFVRPLVKDRLLISNDGWEHTTSDLLTLHNYSRTSEEMNKHFDEKFVDLLLKGENHFVYPNICNVYAGKYRYNGEPIILSEFFGVGFKKDKFGDNWGYGDLVEDDKEYLNILKDQLSYLKAHSYFRGFCFTQLTDVEQEINGIFTIDRTSKCDIHLIHSMFKEIE